MLPTEQVCVRKHVFKMWLGRMILVLKLVSFCSLLEGKGMSVYLKVTKDREWAEEQKHSSLTFSLRICVW